MIVGDGPTPAPIEVLNLLFRTARIATWSPYMKIKRLRLLLLLLALIACLTPFRSAIQSAVANSTGINKGKKTVSDRISEFGGTVHSRLDARFKELGVVYPPKRVLLVGLKQERTLEVWAANESGDFRHLKTYPILGASGTLGPKLAEGEGNWMAARISVATS